MKTEVKKAEIGYNLEFKSLTLGQVMAIRNALKKHDTTVARDICSSLERGLSVNEDFKSFVKPEGTITQQ